MGTSHCFMVGQAHWPPTSAPLILEPSHSPGKEPTGLLVFCAQHTMASVLTHTLHGFPVTSGCLAAETSTHWVHVC